TPASDYAARKIGDTMEHWLGVCGKTMSCDQSGSLHAGLQMDFLGWPRRLSNQDPRMAPGTTVMCQSRTLSIPHISLPAALGLTAGLVTRHPDVVRLLKVCWSADHGMGGGHDQRADKRCTRWTDGYPDAADQRLHGFTSGARRSR